MQDRLPPALGIACRIGRGTRIRLQAPLSVQVLETAAVQRALQELAEQRRQLDESSDEDHYFSDCPST